MTEVLSDQDWELVNAYHDGELSRQDTVSLERRLSSEPELAAALECVEHVSDSLKVLSPKIEIPVADAQANNGLGKWAVGGTLAASFIIAMVFAFPPERKIGVQEIHQAFLNQSFAVGSGELRTVAGHGPFPDLGAANLIFVASRESEIGTAAHYAGRNGCRLTFLSMASPVQVPSQSSMQVQQWNFGAQYFAILASGMDSGKFVAIAEYLRQETRKSALPLNVLALREATRTANRCA